MYKSKSTTVIYSTVFILLIAFSFNCNNIDSSSDDGNNVTKSDRQKYEYIAPGTGFSNGCPTIVNNYLYIGTSSNIPTSNNYVYKFDLTLNKIWEFAIGPESITGSPALDNFGNIYFITDSGRTTQFGSSAKLKLYSLDNNGNLRWSRYIGGNTVLVGMKCLAIAEDNSIYAAGDSLFAFDINGNIKWTYYNTYIPGGVNQAPVIDPNGNIYYASFGKVFSIDKNGNERWIYDLGEYSNCKSSPAFSSNYSSLIIAASKTVYSISTSNGSLIWKYSFNMNADFRSTPAVDDNNIIYIGSHGNGGDNDESTLYALKADGSAILWEKNHGSDFYSSPTLGNDRVIYIGSEGHGNTENKNNRIHAFNMSNGNRIWSAQLPNDVLWGSPILHTNGILYVTTAYIDGSTPSGIYGFQTDAARLLPNCGSPTLQLSNEHNGRRQW
jgi:hypothetical protein